MLKFVYGTDFHGNVKKYSDVLLFAIDHKIPIVHIGADLLPKNPVTCKLKPERFVPLTTSVLLEHKNQCNAHVARGPIADGRPTA